MCHSYIFLDYFSDDFFVFFKGADWVVFDLLFEYLNIEKYLILSDLVSARNLLKNVFGGLEFLEHYNPLRNLSWNNEHRIFTNRKIFTQNKEPLYPSLTK